jgi:hypothetical protein
MGVSAQARAADYDDLHEFEPSESVMNSERNKPEARARRTCEISQG